MVKQFAATFLPAPLVYITGFGIAISYRTPTNMTPKDQFHYAVLSAVHDEALSISDAIDQAYREHVAGKDAEIERLRAGSAKFEQLLSEALRQGWLNKSKTSPSWLQEAQEALAAVAK